MGYADELIGNGALNGDAAPDFSPVVQAAEGTASSGHNSDHGDNGPPGHGNGGRYHGPRTLPGIAD
jgi:hypothetical protein